MSASFQKPAGEITQEPKSQTAADGKTQVSKANPFVGNSHRRQTVLISKITAQVAAALKPQNRFSFLLEDPHKTDQQVDECFARATNFSLHEIFCGICCYRNAAKRIQGLKHFEQHINAEMADDNEFIDEKRRLTNVILTTLIKNAKTKDDLDLIKKELTENAKTIPYYSRKRSDYRDCKDKSSDQWNNILNALNAAYSRVLSFRSAGPVGAKASIGHQQIEIGQEEPLTPRMGYTKL